MLRIKHYVDLTGRSEVIFLDYYGYLNSGECQRVFHIETQILTGLLKAAQDDGNPRQACGKKKPPPKDPFASEALVERRTQDNFGDQ